MTKPVSTGKSSSTSSASKTFGGAELPSTPKSTPTPFTRRSPTDPGQDHNPLWDHKADCAFPSATQNEINGKDAQHLLDNGIFLVSEGANMPTTPDGVDLFLEKGLLYGPGKAANAGGVSVSGLEMSQNSMRLHWTRKEVDERLQIIMRRIHETCVASADQYGLSGNYVAGANIAGFTKVVEAMLDQGLV